MDADSLSDRQCYVRSHFVELFVASDSDVSARHSRGAQKLNIGQVGMRCAYCVKLKPRDRAERAVCYPSSISRIYQTVADMQRFHFEHCRAIPARVVGIYKSLKTTRPRGVGSPQGYWDRSAREVGLMDTELGIQAVSSCEANTKVDNNAAMFDGEVGRLIMQKKSLASGMLERLDPEEEEEASRPLEEAPQGHDDEVVINSMSGAPTQVHHGQHHQGTMLQYPQEHYDQGMMLMMPPPPPVKQEEDVTAVAMMGSMPFAQGVPPVEHQQHYQQQTQLQDPHQVTTTTTAHVAAAPDTPGGRGVNSSTAVVSSPGSNNSKDETDHNKGILSTPLRQTRVDDATMLLMLKKNSPTGGGDEVQENVVAV